MNKLTYFAVALGLILCLACGERTTPLIVCHNSNCVEPPEPTEDDNLESLQASLQLTDAQQHPLLDGVEIDTFWYGEEARCIFAHDLESGRNEAPEVAAALILDHLRARRSAGQSLTRNGGDFVLFVELKGHVGLAKSDKHSPEQRSSHADCAVALLQQCATVANTDGIHMQVTFTSFDPSLLRALRTALEQSAYSDSDYIAVKLGAIRGTPAPLAGDNATIDQFDDDVNMVTVHPHWMRQADYEAFKSRGWELGFWMFSSVPETYDAINRYQPRYVTTNEAQTLTRWLER